LYAVYFVIAKATQQDTSNPKCFQIRTLIQTEFYSTKLRAISLQRQVVLLDVCGMDSKVSLQNRRFHRTIDRHFGQTETLKFLYIICYYEVDPKCTYDSRWVIFFEI